MIKVTLTSFNFKQDHIECSRLGKAGILFVNNLVFEVYDIKTPNFFELLVDEDNKIIAIKFIESKTKNCRKVGNVNNSKEKSLNLNRFLNFYNFEKRERRVFVPQFFENNLLKLDLSEFWNATC